MIEPAENSRWKHHSGRIYTVLFLTNEPDEEGFWPNLKRRLRIGRTGKYPRTVVYQGDNGKRWSGSLWDWHSRMTEITS
jgi:hypothetical protein